MNRRQFLRGAAVAPVAIPAAVAAAAVDPGSLVAVMGPRRYGTFGPRSTVKFINTLDPAVFDDYLANPDAEATILKVLRGRMPATGRTA